MGSEQCSSEMWPSGLEMEMRQRIRCDTMMGSTSWEGVREERIGRVIFTTRSELSESSGCVESDVKVEGPPTAPESVGMLVDAGVVCCLS